MARHQSIVSYRGSIFLVTRRTAVLEVVDLTSKERKSVLYSLKPTGLSGDQRLSPLKLARSFAHRFPRFRDQPVDVIFKRHAEEILEHTDSEPVP